MKWLSLLLIALVGCAAPVKKAAIPFPPKANPTRLPARLRTAHAAAPQVVTNAQAAAAFADYVKNAPRISSAKTLRQISTSTNYIRMTPNGTGFDFNLPHATNKSWVIYFAVAVPGDRRFDGWFVAYGYYDTPTNAYSYAPNFPNQYGPPPEIIAVGAQK